MIVGGTRRAGYQVCRALFVGDLDVERKRLRQPHRRCMNCTRMLLRAGRDST
jgi:hypothetical protein